MRNGIWLVCLVALYGCGSMETQPILAGEACYRCQRAIVLPKLAAQIVDTGGKTMTFRTVACMSRFLSDRDVTVRAVLVTDYTTGRLLPVGNASFVKATIDEATGEEDYVAFRALGDAREFGAEHRSHPVDWEVVRVHVAQRPL
jgi:hypothetical protein